MNVNRYIPDAFVIPVLTYPDVRKAVTWLADASGFTGWLRIGEDHRSQLRFGGGGMLIVADVRGDRFLAEPAGSGYGERQYGAEGPFGRQWTFSRPLADVTPRQWGGELAEGTQ